ncbi:hypothetical protein PHYBOEH_003363 [Phytophthora boehmeriae]|uniref:K Homology domain-containing protein n=1 Tax=Phytophthora boehmeriae TaxID=109152 RepID=A0A8T1WST5_9STRA|nr:hypothetical protein PHYBOEH_003363 [Phytophthora boehmeriae]
MGVISVGASLGVREARSAAAAPISSASAPRRPSVVPNAASSASNGRKKPSRKRSTGSGGSKEGLSAKKRVNYALNSAKSDRPAAAATVPVSRRSCSPSAQDMVVTKVLAATAPAILATKRLEKPQGRMVQVPTTMDPQRLAPHVIGVNGGKLNAVMSQARCSISYRKPLPQENADAGQDTAADGNYSMAFMISATTNKRIEDGVQLLQAVVESTEQQLRKNESVQESSSAEIQTGDAVQVEGPAIVRDADDAPRSEEAQHRKEGLSGRHQGSESDTEKSRTHDVVSESAGGHNEGNNGRSSNGIRVEAGIQQSRHLKRKCMIPEIAAAGLC